MQAMKAMNALAAVRCLLLSLLVAVSLALAALTLDEAKQRGLVGEDAGGYLAVVVAAPNAELRALVRDVNEQRRLEYERIAADNGIDVADVELLAGRKAIEKTAPGHYIRLPGGGWRQK